MSVSTVCGFVCFLMVSVAGRFSGGAADDDDGCLFSTQSAGRRRFGVGGGRRAMGGGGGVALRARAHRSTTHTHATTLVIEIHTFRTAIFNIFSLATKCSSYDTGGHFVNELCVCAAVLVAGCVRAAVRRARRARRRR